MQDVLMTQSWHDVLYYVGIPLILIAPTILTFVQIYKSRNVGSDQFFHQALISQIRNNAHKMVLKHDFLLYNPEIIYPQLLHWLLSFFPVGISEKIGKYMTILFALLSSLIFVWFTLEIYPVVSGVYEISFKRFLLLASLVYALTPFNFNMTNAKNFGMSVRGLGLFLGQLYFYSIVLYMLSGGVVYWIVMVIVAWLTFLSNIFGKQVIILSAPLLALFYQDLTLVIIPLLGLGLFFVTTPGIAKNYFKGRIVYMDFYAKIIKHKIRFSERQSIWRDLVWDFWKIIYRRLKNDKTEKRGWFYIYDNTFVSLIFGFPFLLPLMFMLVKQFSLGSTMLTNTAEPLRILWIPVLVSLLLFIATSFKKTKHLGEPVRYVEYINSLIGIIAVVSFINYSTLFCVALGFCLLFIFFNLYLYFTRSTSEAKTKFKEEILAVNGQIPRKSRSRFSFVYR